jgi:ATP-binding cassette subfamily B protein
MGSSHSVGGLSRTYGLHDHFSRPEQDGPLPQLTAQRLKRILGYFIPYWKQWMVVLACVALAAGLNVLPPLCVQLILDRAIPHAEHGLLALLAGAMVALAATGGLIGVLQQSLTASVGQSIMYDLRNELFRRLQTMSLHFYTANRSGEIVSRISNDVGAVQSVVSGTLVAIAGNAFALVATSIAIFTLNWRLALLSIMVVPAFYLPSIAVGRIRSRLAARTQESQAALLALMQERLHVGGALLTKAFGQAQADAGAFQQGNARLRDLNVRQAVVGRWLFAVLGVFSVVGPALVYWYGGLQVMESRLSLGQLVAFAALLTLLYRPLMQLATVYVDVQASVAIFERIFEYLDMEPGVKDAPEATVLARARGHIRFQGVGFSYPAAAVQEGDEPAEARHAEPFALRDVTFEVLPGERVALVGPSGSGKTTITYLVPRFYDPTAGRVFLDDRDIRDLTQESLRRHIGIVTQETFLFHASIRENLLYARSGATQAELAAACRAANIHEFIAGLPGGYDTVVGDRGFRLSGGEKQRVSIARALLKDPAILILDEATSSLDATSEFLIQEALEKLLRNRTSLIIAHRLSTVLGADRIVVLDNGRIVEVGDHEELLGRSGLYAELFRQQFARVLQSNHAGRIGADRSALAGAAQSP